MKDEMTVSAWAKRWFEIHAEGKLSKNTVGGYRNLIFRHIGPYFEGTTLSKLTEQKAADFYHSLGEKGLGERSVWCVHLLLRRILYEACREGLLERNPVDRLEPNRREQATPPRLRGGQVKRYLAAAEQWNEYPILYLGLASGLRQGELISLTWAAFDSERKRLLLPKRWVKLSDKAAELLQCEYERHPESACIFLDPKTGEPYQIHRLYYVHRCILKQINLPNVGFRELQRCAGRLEL